MMSRRPSRRVRLDYRDAICKVNTQFTGACKLFCRFCRRVPFAASLAASVLHTPLRALDQTLAATSRTCCGIGHDWHRRPQDVDACRQWPRMLDRHGWELCWVRFDDRHRFRRRLLRPEREPSLAMTTYRPAGRKPAPTIIRPIHDPTILAAASRARRPAASVQSHAHSHLLSAHPPVRLDLSAHANRSFLRRAAGLVGTFRPKPGI